MGVRGSVLACLGLLIAAPLLYAQPEPATPSLVERQPWDQQSVTDGLYSVQDAFERIVRETGIDPTAGPVTEIAEPTPAVPATDLGSQLVKSPTVESVSVQQRSPVSFDPHIRGYTGGQVYAASDGVFWSPVRRDLDSMLSKIDPSLVRDVVVIPGPYGLRYGPGFAFIDVATFPTPRYDCFESHGRLGVDVQTNGGRIFGRTTAFGGGPNYGYAVNYGNRVGGDYMPGGIYPRIPASYQNQTVWGQFGFDLSDEYSVEFRYLRLDQTDTEYALQFFDVDSLATDSFSLSLAHNDHCVDSVWTTTVWHNRTRFDGDTRKDGKRLDFFPVLQRVDAALANADAGPYVVGETFGDYTSTGVRTMKTYGETGWTQLNLGADFRYLEQHIREDFDAGAQSPTEPIPAEGPDVFYTNQPRSHAIDPGLFAELSVPTTDYWTTRIGARVDYFQTDAKGFGTYDGQRQDSNYIDTPLLQNDILYAFYVAGDLELTEKWLVTGGFGHAQRVPTLTERYADGLFLGIIQNGFSRVIGDPELDPERAWQVDLGLEAKEENWRGFVRGYYSWIIDYVTYQANIIGDPSGARLFGRGQYRPGHTDRFRSLWGTRPDAALGGVRVRQPGVRPGR